MLPELPALQGNQSRIQTLRLRAVWLLWFAIIGVVLARGLIAPNKNSCFRDHYQPGGLNWFHGNDLYQSTADTCRYSPFVHAFLVPFSLLPDPWGATVWRLAGGIAFLAALSWWLRAVCPVSLNHVERAWILLLAIPLSIGSLNNGQSNVFLMAGILAGMAAISEKRWNMAALAIAFACLFKLYPAALAMLLVAIYPRQFGLRFVLALAAGALLPFLLQDPGYVARQYDRWFGNLAGDDRSNWHLYEAYRDVWLLIRQADLPISTTGYRLIQLGMGGFIGLVCLGMRYRGDQGRDLLNRVLGLGCCWMTAFGPATESPTYILLGPTLAWLLLQSWLGKLPRWTRLPMTLSAILFFATVVAVATPYGRAMLVLGTQPLAALLILGTLLATIATQPAREEEVAPTLPLKAPQSRGIAA